VLVTFNYSLAWSMKTHINVTHQESFQTDSFVIVVNISAEMYLTCIYEIHEQHRQLCRYNISRYNEMLINIYSQRIFGRIYFNGLVFSVVFRTHREDESSRNETISSFR
jgi:hypothetical protein